jgi:hypothetical protein
LQAIINNSSARKVLSGPAGTEREPPLVRIPLLAHWKNDTLVTGASFLSFAKGPLFWGEAALQPVRLVLLLLTGPREGENDFLEFPSVEEAVAYGRELFDSPRLQLEAVEELSGRTLIAYDWLNDLCRPAQSMQQRRYG